MLHVYVYIEGNVILYSQDFKTYVVYKKHTFYVNLTG